MKDDYCSHCGGSLTGLQYPKQCPHCGQFAYSNPLPVGLILVPVGLFAEQGVLLVRRGIRPALGDLALPGGFMNTGESWQAACARELREETSLIVEPREVKLFRMQSDPGHLLVFATVPGYKTLDITQLQHDDEVVEFVISNNSDDITHEFPLHRRVMKEFLRDQEMCRAHAEF